MNFVTSNYFLSQPSSGDGTDGVANFHAGGVAAMFKSSKQTYLDRNDGTTVRNRMNGLLERVIRTTKGLNTK
ncbi:MAG: hypothetical protein JXR03_18065 [Cyclobacteriaceae bacterium]